ncbi:MAG TPA: hypothetical protein VH277_09305, partial [Gemmatimonadaceae bacterium]|nr:hypothetical protein [Gemmatimonadaceae bacterium]
MNRILIVGGVVSALALGACSSDVSSPATLQLSANDSLQAVSLSASDATAEDVDIMTAAEASMDGSAGASASTYDRFQTGGLGASMSTSAAAGDSIRFAFWSFAGSCAYSSATGRFTCPDVVKNGLTLSRSAAFTDANGTAMAHFNDTTTASANFQITVSGVHQRLLGADTISRTRNMTATGLLGHETTRTWNGTGTRSDGGYMQDTAKVRTYHTSDAVTFTNVVVKLPRTQNPWPQSGTVTRQISGTGSVVAGTTTRTFNVTKTVTITFNGTRLVPMMVGNVAFTLDLYTGKAVKN